MVPKEAHMMCFSRPLPAQEAAPVLRRVTRAEQHPPRQLVGRSPRRNQRRRPFVLATFTHHLIGHIIIPRQFTILNVCLWKLRTRGLISRNKFRQTKSFFHR